MNILSPLPFTTEGWANKIHQHQFPDWKTASPAVGKKWSQDFQDRPWFDREGAELRVAAMLNEGAISSDEHQLMLQWVRDGYFVLPEAIASKDFGLLDKYVQGVDDVWTTDKVLDGLQISGLRVDGTKRGPIGHAELISWPLEKRIRLRDTETWRIHYYQSSSPEGLMIAQSNRIMRLCGLLLQSNPTLLNLTTYKYSSEVALHQDMWFYHLHPANHMLGVWLACEDVRPDTGPLAVYPGSHRIPMWPGFGNYPQTNYRTCHPARYEEIESYLGEGVKNIERISLPVKKGDAVFLNGLNVHDADKVAKRGVQTRFSIVLHYAAQGVNKINEVEGPFNY